VIVRRVWKEEEREEGVMTRARGEIDAGRHESQSDSCKKEMNVSVGGE
jgi:hypothetical protein